MDLRAHPSTVPEPPPIPDSAMDALHAEATLDTEAGRARIALLATYLGLRSFRDYLDRYV